jgi:hypothetical protein
METVSLNEIAYVVASEINGMLSNSPIVYMRKNIHCLSASYFHMLIMQVMKTLRHVSLARLSREIATFANARKMGCQQHVQ